VTREPPLVTQIGKTLVDGVFAHGPLPIHTTGEHKLVAARDGLRVEKVPEGLFLAHRMLMRFLIPPHFV
jgi:hypothetical protein